MKAKNLDLPENQANVLFTPNTTSVPSADDNTMSAASTTKASEVTVQGLGGLVMDASDPSLSVNKM